MALLFGGALVTALGFMAGILAGVGPGFVLHEVAGLLLLAWLVPAVVASLRVRSSDSRPLRRAVVALVALVVAGALGASLATTTLPPDWAGAPLLPLVVLIVAAGDGLRVSRSSAPEP
ncbi:MAG: hypothetical protein L3K16_06550 [Thermoplasmata archaeon]|nr:hypothetical protein [Thermoplasmata archaeon]